MEIFSFDGIKIKADTQEQATAKLKALLNFANADTTLVTTDLINKLASTIKNDPAKIKTAIKFL